ncbi:MAG TPA: amino acid adenylation domain-containing protein [Thermoanaerobaculia bacterium]|nr:amino acid adenylation domain-containing protein [Thermoanaerobaculia bacterium]
MTGLSHGQRALWFLHRVAPASDAYTIAGAGRVLSPLDTGALRRGFEALVERHEAVRTVFPAAGGEPIRRPGPADPHFFEEVDASSWPEAEARERLADLAFRPFDLERGPLFRVVLARGGSAGSVIVVSMHHVVGDLWSLAVLLRELGATYRAALEGREPAAELRRLPLSYAEWVAREQVRLAGEEGRRLRAFWRRRLAGGVPPLDLPGDRPRPRIRAFQGRMVSRSLGREAGSEGSLRSRLDALARSRRSHRFTVLLAGFQALLGRYSGQEAFAVGTPTSGRVRTGGASVSELASLVGYFVNPVPIRADLAADPSFGELVERVREEAAGALEHQAYPFALLAEDLEPGSDPSRSPLFQVMLVLQKSPIPGMRGLPAFALGREGAPLRLGPLELESAGLPQRGAQLDLTLFVTEEDGELVGSLEYDAALFEAATAERALGHLATLLHAAAADPERRLSELPILTPDERRQLLVELAPGEGLGRDAGAPVDALLHQLVAAQAERTPEAEALWAADGRLSYRELVARARAVGRYLRRRLRELEAGPEPLIGVFLERGADLLSAVLGILEAGGAYVPMDPDYPPERLAMMIDDSGMPIVLASERSALRIAGSAGVRVVTVAEAAEQGRAIGAGPAVVPASISPDRLAYVIYTSGSTGRPKGVAISHRSAAAMLRWAGEAFDREELAGVLASTSISFDLSVFELFAPLVHGGRVILAADALALPGLAAAGEVTLVNTVPSAMAQVVAAGPLPPSVRTVNLAGEPLRRALVDAVYAAGRVERVLNLYGPSEDTTYSTLAACPREETREPAIGRVVPGSRSYVVDRHLRLVPAGLPGELLLGGEGLARGYLGRPALTAGRFVPDPFAGQDGGGGVGGLGGRLYRTGDRVRYGAGGALEFLGRLDHQVKVRGFRIEPGEIELALRRHPAVADAVVVARGEGADRSLAAYLVGARDLPPVGEIRSFLAARLPGFMVPSAFVALEALPRTPNGKVDRAALPAPGADRPPLEAEYVAPETPVEEILAGLWREALGVERIGIHDSFFALGGHSLKATRVLLRVREVFGVDVPVHRLFERPTIAGLAVAIADQLLARSDAEDAEELLAHLREPV